MATWYSTDPGRVDLEDLGPKVRPHIKDPAPSGKFLKDDGTWAAPGGGPPAAHAASHQNGGGDEINVAGLSGELADPQPPKAHTQAGSTILLDKIGASTYETAQHFARFCGTAGRITGGTMTDAGGGNLDVAAGAGILRTTAAQTGELKWFDWPALLGTAIPDGTIRYVGVEYNAGAPQVSVRATDNWNYYTDFPLGFVARQGAVLHISTDGREFADQLGRLLRRFYGTRPFERDERAGGLILGETGVRNITLTAGSLWDRSNDFPIAAFDSSGASRFDRYYRDGAGGWTEEATQSQWPNTQYDDGSGVLATLGAAKWGVHWFYLEPDGDIVMLYGQGNFTTQSTAAASSPPSTTPNRLIAGRLIGRLIFQKSAATALVETVFTTMFSASGVTEHGNLAGLSDDDHTQYPLLAGRGGAPAVTDAQFGYLSGVTSAIQTQLGGKASTSHEATHEPGGSDAMTVDAAAATGSLRTLGAGASQAAAGNHTHPYWYNTSLLAIAYGDGIPSATTAALHYSAGAAAASKPTGTEVGSVVRLTAFRVPGAITVATVRYYTQVAAANVFQLGIYDGTSGSLLWSAENIATGSGAWQAISIGGGLALGTDRHYWLAFGAVATSGNATWRTLQMIQAASGTDRNIALVPLPGSLATGSGAIGMCAYAQFTKSNLADTLATYDPLPALATAAWSTGTGTLPLIWLDSV